MGQYDNITVHVDSEHKRSLEPIEPFPIVAEALSEAVENFSYTRLHSNSDPKIAFYRKGSDKGDECEFIPSCLPRVFVQMLDSTCPRFLIRIDIPLSDVDTVGSEYLETLRSSVFFDFFKPCIYACMQGFLSVLEVDVLTMSRLITYYLKLLGLHDPDCVDVNKRMYVSRGDMSLAVIPDEVTAPDTFRRAFAKLKELDMQEEDCMYLRLLASDSKTCEESMEIQVWEEDGSLFFSEEQKVGDREALECRRAYRNFDCISYYIYKNTYKEIITFGDPDFMMRFLTDYFLFLYPHVKAEDIVTSIACVKESGYDDVTYIEFFFYPDGSEDSPEKLEEFITTMHKWRDED